jgi:HSP20 family molecular chaperone IbpA
MTYAPRIDVYDKDSTLVLTAEVPGLKKEDVQVEPNSGNLVTKSREEALITHCTTFGSFYRSQRSHLSEHIHV